MSARAALLLLVLLGWTAPAAGHGLAASYTEIAVSPSRLTVIYLLAVEDIAAHFPIPIDGTGGITHSALEDAAPAIFAFLGEHLSVTLDERTSLMDRGGHGRHGGGTYVRFEFSRALAAPPSAVAFTAREGFFECLGPQHTNFVSLAVEGRTRQDIVTVHRPRATFATGYAPGLSQWVAFFRLGIAHILAGYDHLVFLVALLIIGGSLAQLVKVVTAFTVAHSVTLALAALQVVVLPARLVEGTIALTIAYVAFDNFFASGTAHRPLLTFCFGLIHGFGFAHVLREMEPPGSQLVSALLGFNLGVEAGQLLVVAVLFPAVVWLSRQSFSRLVVATASGAAFVFGTGWFLQRMLDLSFMPR